MNVSIELTPDLVNYLKSKREGGYTSRSEVVRDALRKMMMDDLSLAARKVSPEEFENRRKIVGEDIVRARFPEML
jgi:Arc/MetJ-type ribon-helix-helix transcriptional regulator